MRDEFVRARRRTGLIWDPLHQNPSSYRRDATLSRPTLVRIRCDSRLRRSGNIALHRRPAQMRQNAKHRGAHELFNTLFGVGLATLASFATGTAESANKTENCRGLAYAGNSATVCTFDTRRHKISLRWRQPDDTPFASLYALRSSINQVGETFLFAMNGGMYHDDLSPVGYYVEQRRKLKNANTRPGPGNFHMRPNGIFYLEGRRAGVMETRAFLKRNRRPDFATQSGPMLVIGGRIHPIFKPDSTSRKYRNGVGVTADGHTVHFAISNRPITFYAFAKLFQIKLKTPNALFLDGGSVPQMISSTVSRASFAPVGPIVAVTKRRSDTTAGPARPHPGQRQISRPLPPLPGRNR